MNQQAIVADHAFLNDEGWVRDVLLVWDDEGSLTHVVPEVRFEGQWARFADCPRARGPIMPGVVNGHSHAFQAAMAGLAEYQAEQADSFWSWRDLMYRYANRIEPSMLRAIAHWLYIQMLKAGYTSVCEFHYIHRSVEGEMYDEVGLLSTQVIDAAQAAGIGLTMLPVLYQYSNFGAQPARADQRRFILTPDEMMGLLQALRTACPEHQGLRYGVAPHSLRAVSAAGLQELLTQLDAEFPQAPVHIHIAEQTAEVQESVQFYGARPVAWLLANFDVNERWSLIHATHIDEAERQQLATGSAVVGLCLTTEANLGDGFFPAPEFLAAGGRFSVGSDSNVSIDWCSELRLLEYGQRLLYRQRNLLADEQQPDVGHYLFSRALRGGAQASGRATAGLAVGQQADFLVLDAQHPLIAELPSNAWLSSMIFRELGTRAIADVFVGGKQVIFNGQHPDEQQAQADYGAALAQLLHA